MERERPIHVCRRAQSKYGIKEMPGREREKEIERERERERDSIH